MAEHKGIGVNEVSSTFGFYAPSGTGSGWNRFTSASKAVAGSISYGCAWNGDLTLIGHFAVPFIVRGGYCNGGSDAGVVYSSVTHGYNHYAYGFRAVLVV